MSYLPEICNNDIHIYFFIMIIQLWPRTEDSEVPPEYTCSEPSPPLSQSGGTVALRFCTKGSGNFPKSYQWVRASVQFGGQFYSCILCCKCQDAFHQVSTRNSFSSGNRKYHPSAETLVTLHGTYSCGSNSPGEQN